MASCIFSSLNQWMISIPETRNLDGVVYYDIMVQIGDVSWTVSRRYNEFSQLNTALIKEQGLNKCLLPPKRFVGNANPEFVDQRRGQLELYLNTIFKLLVKTMPSELASFLELEEHDIMFIIRKIPDKLSKCKQGTGSCPELRVLDIHALSTRLKLPCPPAEMSGYQHDFCCILESCSRLKALRVDGTEIANMGGHLPSMDFIPFKALRHLILNNVPPDFISNADALRNTLCGLSWLNSGLKSVEDALLCDSVHKNLFDQKVWSLKKFDLSNNALKEISDAVTMIPNLTVLELSGNQIECLGGLNSLEKLEKLSLKNNGIKTFSKLGLDNRLSKLTWLNLHNNNLSSVKGIEFLKELRYLDITNNRISDFKEVALISSLPQVATLILCGNPISFVCDYRVKVLELFNERATFISLDHELPNQRELDKIAVLQALRMVKEGRAPI
uniref:Nischarin n=3 Tax=Lygus hesperus TaxID=30085 RepID=A0A146KQZ6_LYGHE